MNSKKIYLIIWALSTFLVLNEFFFDPNAGYIELVLFLLLETFFTINFLAIDALIERQYSLHFDSWVADGKRHGIGWEPKGFKWHQNLFPKKGPSERLLFKMPEWSKSDPYAKLLIWLYRISTFIIAIVFLIFYFRTN